MSTLPGTLVRRRSRPALPVVRCAPLALAALAALGCGARAPLNAGAPREAVVTYRGGIAAGAAVLRLWDAGDGVRAEVTAPARLRGGVSAADRGRFLARLDSLARLAPPEEPGPGPGDVSTVCSDRSTPVLRVRSGAGAWQRSAPLAGGCWPRTDGARRYWAVVDAAFDSLVVTGPD